MNKQIISEYVKKFNQNDEELYIQDISNEQTEEWMMREVPYFESSHSLLEEAYYFRWWVFRKHIKTTPEGRIITEFLPEVDWSGPYNSINCASGHHIAEARWLTNGKELVREYVRFWFEGSGDVYSYSSWIIDAVYQYCLVRGEEEFGQELLPNFVDFYRRIEETNLTKYGLFWSYDDRDAMEMQISGSGLRPTLNSYMYANALAIAHFAKFANNRTIESEFKEKAEELKKKISTFLWDEEAQFFKVIPQATKESDIFSMDFSQIDAKQNVKEAIGYIPWSFGLANEKHEEAWKYLNHSKGFSGDYGPTTAERAHPLFDQRQGHECLWNGPSWPFATTQILSSMIATINQGNSIVTMNDFHRELANYAGSFYLINEQGEKVNWIDENLDPDSGEWLARKFLKEWGWLERKGGYERGKDYNHSAFGDLIIRGYCGINIEGNDKLIFNPLGIEEEYDYFALIDVPIRDKKVSIFYDKNGTKYSLGKGVIVLVDGEKYFKNTNDPLEITI